MKRVYVEGSDNSIYNLMILAGYTRSLMEDADAIVFTGGADVSPMMYGHEKHPTTHNSIDRDMRCMHMFNYGQRNKLEMLGICRGAQFLNIMNGGTLAQDVEDHGRTHMAKDVRSGGVHKVTSTHHQMMLPHISGSVIAIATHNASITYYDPKKGIFVQEDEFPGNEVVWYKTTKSLCFQPHPEYGEKSCEKYFISLVREFFSGEKKGLPSPIDLS